jgi:type IV pilus assembly protein PilM
MATSGSVWAIDIGQCALKALKCRPHDDPKKIVAEAFDYIEYPKILSQPDSNPDELIGEALGQFLSRNSVKNDLVAISVPGVAGLMKFIPLPPVESSKIKAMVQYEQKQHIPFDPKAIVLRWQAMAGGKEEAGVALETEVGLFAIKRDTESRARGPFENLGIDVDLVQLGPVALYNFILFDQLRDLPPPEEYDPESPPESIAIISVGTDATDVLSTNGYKVLHRSLPIGGNHFTKALSKELKLTFAKAEHLKRNAASAQDPKAVFQAMRPVFSELSRQLQQSFVYFGNINRESKIKRIVALGNAMKLPGLRRYLSQNLGLEIERLDGYHGLTGSEVLAAAAFKENLSCFDVCYGLALQGLGKAGLNQNMLPDEIRNARMIKQKKPWAIAAAAVLMLALTLSLLRFTVNVGAVEADEWKPVETKAGSVATTAEGFDKEARGKVEEFKTLDQIGQHLVGNVEGRVVWLELLKFINECLPKTGEKLLPPPAGKEGDLAWQVQKREELRIDSLECRWEEDLAKWFEGVKKDYQDLSGDQAAAKPEGGDQAAPTGPSGAGWVMVVKGHHYHNLKEDFRSATGTMGAFVRNTLVKNLQTRTVELPGSKQNAEPGKPARPKPWTPAQMGIGYALLYKPGNVQPEELEDPNAALQTEAATTVGTPAKKEAAKRTTIDVDRFDFEVQFCWKPTPPAEREANLKTKAGENK